MRELWGVLWLLAALGLLASAAALAACCLRRSSSLEFLLTAYVLAWTWLVAATLVLSPFALVTRTWLLGAASAGLLGALAAWIASGRPPPPRLVPAASEAFHAVRTPILATLGLAVVVSAVYTTALGLLTPANDGDALAYHLARAAFWHQEHGVGYVPNVVDIRLNGNPPNAEIGQLVTMVLAGNDRYVALPQLFAYVALALCAVALARRIGLTLREALFGALLFATLPVVVLQASGALNDLVVASFLGVAVLFALGSDRISLGLAALALALGLGTKLTAVLTLPTLVAVVALARPRRGRLELGAAGLLGLALGSVWYVVNLVETGELDGGLAEASDQRAELTLPAVTTSTLRHALDVVDMSGALWPYSAMFLVAACVLVGVALLRRNEAGSFRSLGTAAVLTALPLLAAPLVPTAQDLIVRWWAGVGRPETAPFELGWDLNEVADPALSWYGPLGTLLLPVGVVTGTLLWRRGASPLLVGLAAATWLLLLTLAVTITWDPFRGRFILVGVLLAAVTWGTLLRWRALSTGAVAIGVVTLGLTLLNYQGKPSGLGSVLGIDNPFRVTVSSIWTMSRTEAQTLVRPGSDDGPLLSFVERAIPPDARVAVAPRENDFLSPFFGPGLSRHVTLVRLVGDVAPADAEWLVLAPGSRVRRCPGAWARELETDSGWRVERRVAADACELG